MSLDTWTLEHKNKEDICLTNTFVIKLYQPQEKTLCFDSQ